jgi:hypothetical protein
VPTNLWKSRESKAYWLATFIEILKWLAVSSEFDAGNLMYLGINPPLSERRN